MSTYEADHLRDINADVCAIKDHLLTEQPTWLDRCAWVAMQGLLARPDVLEKGEAMLARMAYNQATTMLAEKRKREGAP